MTLNQQNNAITCFRQSKSHENEVLHSLTFLPLFAKNDIFSYFTPEGFEKHSDLPLADSDIITEDSAFM